MTDSSPCEFEPRDRAAYLPGADALVAADLHLGRGETANVGLPLGETDAVVERLDALVERFGPGEVVIAGDVFDAFSHLPGRAAAALDRLRDRTEAAGASLVLVRGNHDTMLESVADAVDEHRLDDGTVVRHGHDDPELDAERYAIGHHHPAIEIEGRRRPCYLVGEGAYRGDDVLVLPAFNRLCAGTPVNGLPDGAFDSPLVTDLSAFRPVVRDPDADERLEFPPLGALREFL